MFLHFSLCLSFFGFGFGLGQFVYFIRFRAMGIHFGGFVFEFWIFVNANRFPFSNQSFLCLFSMFSRAHVLSHLLSLYQFNPNSDFFTFFSFSLSLSFVECYVVRVETQNPFIGDKSKNEMCVKPMFFLTLKHWLGKSINHDWFDVG